MALVSCQVAERCILEYTYDVDVPDSVVALGKDAINEWLSENYSEGDCDDHHGSMVDTDGQEYITDSYELVEEGETVAA